MAEITRVGYIGLGAMGRPMAGNLLKAGYQVIVHNRSRPAVEELVRAGAEDGGSPRGVAERAQVICTCLPDSADVQAVMEGSQGILAGIGPGQVVVDMSTISPAVTRRLATQVAARGAEMLDAPVSGGPGGAAAGALAIMVGGRREAFEYVLPVLRALGTTIVYMGEAGAGQLAKVCSQIVVLVTVEAVSEALVFARKAGLDLEKMLQILLAGWGQSKVMEVHGRRIVETDFQPQFPQRLMIKDVNILLEAGEECGVALPAVRLVREMLLAGGYAAGEVR